MRKSIILDTVMLPRPCSVAFCTNPWVRQCRAGQSCLSPGQERFPHQYRSQHWSQFPPVVHLLQHRARTGCLHTVMFSLVRRENSVYLYWHSCFYNVCLMGMSSRKLFISLKSLFCSRFYVEVFACKSCSALDLP